MSFDRSGMINKIADQVGFDEALAERVFIALSESGKIYFDNSVNLNLQGFVLREGIDLFEEAKKITGKNIWSVSFINALDDIKFVASVEAENYCAAINKAVVMLNGFAAENPGAYFFKSCKRS